MYATVKTQSKLTKMKSNFAKSLAIIVFAFLPCLVFGQKIQYSILKVSKSVFADADIAVLITPKATNQNVKWVCKDLIRKYNTRYLTIYFWSSKEQYNKDGGMALGHNLAHYDGNRQADGVYVTYPDGSREQL